MAQFLEVGKGAARRRIAVEKRDGVPPCIVWLGGFRSDMRGTKAEALDAFAAAQGRAFLRFDYSGHGESEGAFEDGTISRWSEEALAVIDAHAGERPLLVGSSMGGWIALLVARALLARGAEHAPSGMVLIAPAPDFTEKLMWPAFNESARRAIMEEGRFVRPSLYDDDGYVITRALIEDGRRNLVLDGPIATGCPVHILQGMADPDVPWRHALATLEAMPTEEVAMTLVKDGDHRLSRPEDIERLLHIIAAMAGDLRQEKASP